jgi:hypothetical protein
VVSLPKLRSTRSATSIILGGMLIYIYIHVRTYHRVIREIRPRMPLVGSIEGRELDRVPDKEHRLSRLLETPGFRVQELQLTILLNTKS